MSRFLIRRLAGGMAVLLLLAAPSAAQKIHIAFMWHMHQPNYYPSETILETEDAGHYEYSVVEIHTTRSGPYTWWPNDAVSMGIDAGMPHFGAQVSLTGSLIENLNELEGAGIAFQNWHQPWNEMRSATTSLGNPRIDLVGFGYFHPLMGLLWPDDMVRQIEKHRELIVDQFDGAVTSNGIFPPENAFSERMIPALVDAGIEWVLVDNVHFDRAAHGYPWTSGGSVVEPNGADVMNPDPGDWVQLTDLWAPTQVSARWGHQPHYAEYVDPSSGETSRVIVVPASRYLGNEDGRGGFGALQYDTVLSQLEPYNTDPEHPILVVLHHDGDNHGGGTDSYYHSNFAAMVDWLEANPARFEVTTIQDYLDRFPPDDDDVIHVEPGSWAGADAGDPEFKKWLGDPVGGYSPDHNSWGVITAAKQWVDAAIHNVGDDGVIADALRWLHMGQASDYWYWDGAQGGIWDTHPTRAANLAIDAAESGAGGDFIAPTIFLPQREPYNPGGTEWGEPMPSTFDVWTYIYDIEGVENARLLVREDFDGVNDPATDDNETYEGGPGVSNWIEIPMTATWIEPQTNVAPLHKALEYRATVSGYSGVLLDYYVMTMDDTWELARSPIQHVYVGTHGGGGGTEEDLFAMNGVLADDAYVVEEDGDLTLWAAVAEGQLYLAAPAAQGLGEDVFLVVANDPGDLQPAMWAKAGEAAAWDLFLGNESTNNYCGFTDSQAANQCAAGGVVECLIPIEDEFGAGTSGVYVALATYETQDGGALTDQLPANDDGDGDLDDTEFRWIDFTTVGVHDSRTESPRPEQFALTGAYPNPFNGAATVEITLPRAADLTVTVYDITGRRVADLAHGRRQAGTHRMAWDASEMASGVYLVRATVPGELDAARKLLLVK